MCFVKPSGEFHADARSPIDGEVRMNHLLAAYEHVARRLAYATVDSLHNSRRMHNSRERAWVDNQVQLTKAARVSLTLLRVYSKPFTGAHLCLPRAHFHRCHTDCRGCISGGGVTPLVPFVRDTHTSTTFCLLHRGRVVLYKSYSHLRLAGRLHRRATAQSIARAPHSSACRNSTGLRCSSRRLGLSVIARLL